MPAPVTASTPAVHWLAKAIARSGTAPNVELNILPGTSIEDAWTHVLLETSLASNLVAEHAARFLRMEVADLTNSDPTASKLIPESVARRYGVYPVHHSDREVVIAAADPLQPELDQTLAFTCGRRVRLQLAAPIEIRRMIDTRYSPDRMVEEILGGMGEEDSGVQFEDLEGTLGDMTLMNTPVVRLANHIIKSAILQGASDIHLEPDQTGAAVRFRVDGVMKEYMRLPVAVLSRVIARIKVLSKLDIADRLRPQDGRVRLTLAGKRFDLRVSTVPTRDHEKSVIRVLSQDVGISLDHLGLAGPELTALRTLLQERNGIVVVTGPTGSGKTTTLYGALKELATGNVNIVTVEDPVEFDLPGVTQIQVNPKQKVSFASALRAVLRQDPDVILIGEIRDGETAGIAVQAAMTGHLVLATLHANDAAHVVSRLHDLGLEYGAIAGTLRGAIAQRLLRRLCPDCSGAGCESCGTAGYKGRLPVTEVLTVTPEISDLIEVGAPPARLRAMASGLGMRTLSEVGLEHVGAGRTDLPEVERVLGVESETPGVAAVPAVLVVDDDPEARLLVGAILKQGGFTVVEAADGKEALQRIESEGPFSLVTLDLVMAGLGGKETLARIRGDVRTAGLPVLVLTGSETHDQEIELLGQGADDYLRKPIDPQRFLARIQALHRRMRA